MRSTSIRGTIESDPWSNVKLYPTTTTALTEFENAVECLTALLRIPEVPGCNVDTRTDYPKVFLWHSSASPYKC
jgi:hypothetical protein